MMSNLRNLDNFDCKPQLVMIIEPETKIRFRYKSEGGSHGPLTGKKKENGKKTYPTVKLENYHGKKPVYIRVSLYTEDKKNHVFEFKGKKYEEDTRDMTEYLKADNTAIFTNLKILSKKKHEIEKLLMDQKLNNLKSGLTKCVKAQFEKKYIKEVKEKATNMLNSVRLYFEAFEVGEQDVPLCSLFSDVIYNQKTASKGDLKIHRMSKVAGTCRGGEEIILLCDKVQKENIKILFFETDDSDNKVWQSYGEFTPADVHYQVAITFKTPPYKSDIEKTVFVCLERQDEVSEARTFTYTEDISPIPSKKRKYIPEQSVNMSFPEIIESSMSISSPESCSDGTPVDMPRFPQSQLDESVVYQMDANEIQDLDLIVSSLEMDEELNEIFSSIQLPFEDILDSPAIMNQPLILNQSLTPCGFGGEQIQMDVVKIEGQMGVLNINDGAENECLPSLFKKYSVTKSETSKHSESDINKKKQICSDLLLKRDRFGNTLLHIAVLKEKNLACVLKMIQIANSDIIDAKNFKKQTALHIAAGKNQLKAAKILLENGSNPNLRNYEGNNCYHITAENNYVDMMHYIFGLQKFPPDVNAFNYEGLTPLHIAVMKNSKDCFHVLKLHMASTNLVEQKCGRSLLHYAVEFQPSFVKVLLDEGEIDVNIQDFEGNTPLHIACATENIDAVKQLLEAGADPLLKNFKQNSNTLKEENSEDDASDGQTSADITSNIEIQEILRKAPETEPGDQENILDCGSLSGSNETGDQAMEKLCNYLDEDMKWRSVASYFLDENLFDILEFSDSPTKALLAYIKKEHQESYVENFKAVLEIAGLNDAIQIIEEGHLQV